MTATKPRRRWRYIVFGVLIVLIAGIGFMLKNRKGIELAMNPIDFSGAETPDAHDCLWIGPVNHHAFNVAFPDEGAIYWPTVFKLPKGSSLEIAGNYPLARYISYTSYDADYRPYHGLNDQAIQPDAGSRNPFTTAGDDQPGSYTIRVVQQDIPANPKPNTLYLGAEVVESTPLVRRIYVPETEGDLTGGVGMPQTTLITASGERLTGEAMCEAIGSPKIGAPERTIRSPTIAADSYNELLAKNDLSTGFPATAEVDWQTFWGGTQAVMRVMSPKLVALSKTLTQWGLWKQESGFYATLDNHYLSAYTNTQFGEVLVIEGKLPRTPASGHDWPNGGYDLRYWSLCTNEGLTTTRFAGCIYDSEMRTKADRTYKVVISKAADRPANATEECGVNWLDWGDAGDGAGNENMGVLIIRNMIPSPDFKHAIQNVTAISDEKDVLGEYYPTSTYVTRDAFEQLGCD